MHRSASMSSTDGVGKGKGDWSANTVLNVLMAAVLIVPLLFTFGVQQWSLLSGKKAAAGVGTTRVAPPETKVEPPAAVAKPMVKLAPAVSLLQAYKMHAETLLGSRPGNCSDGEAMFPTAAQADELRAQCSKVTRAVSAITGQECPSPHAVLHPYNFVNHYQEEAKRLQALLECTASFAFLRFNDGERDALRKHLLFHRVYKGLKVSRQGEQAAVNATSSADQLAADLENVMRVQDPRYTLGLSVPSCKEGLHNEQMTGGGAPRWIKFFAQREGGELKYLLPLQAWSYSNLLSHRNGRRVVGFMKKLVQREQTVVIANENVKKLAAKTSWGARMREFPATLPQNWQGETRSKWIREAQELARPGGKIFVVALGPVSKILIHKMWETNPSNSYVDIGSLIDSMIGLKSRGWMGRWCDCRSVCQKLGARCTEGRYTVRHDQCDCEAGTNVKSPNCILPLRPQDIGDRMKRFACKNKAGRR